MSSVVSLVRSPAKMQRKKRVYNRGRAMLHRRAKLGDETFDKLKGTSLDSSRELDELIMLNRGAPPGGHTEIVKQLVADAIAGEMVSACAYATEHARTNYKHQSLMAMWKKRMVFGWQQATKEEQSNFVEFLMDSIKKEIET